MQRTQPPLAWGAYAAELIGTALLLLVGLSFVIIDFGAGSQVVTWLPEAGARRLLTGFLFGATGGMIAISPLGKHSGAHLNPAVTLTFWLLGKFSLRDSAFYVLAQLVGAVVGTVPLLAWGAVGRSVELGATVPGPGYSVWIALGGEIAATATMIALLLFFLQHARLKHFTPALFPFLYCVLVYVEAPLSGTSTNPARSFGPLLVSEDFTAWWIYWIGPTLGALLGVALSRTQLIDTIEIRVAKVYHFTTDFYGIFRLHERARENTR